MRKLSREAEGRPKGAVELWKRNRGVPINRQNIEESEQMITTGGQIVPCCKGRMILLFNSTILQGDCHFAEEFFNFERRTKNE